MAWSDLCQLPFSIKRLILPTPLAELTNLFDCIKTVRRNASVTVTQQDTVHPSMGRLKCFLLAFLATFSILYLAHGQSQQGFISIDCGSNSSYTEPITGLNYVSDSWFVDSGTAGSIASYYTLTTLHKQLWNVRSFPVGARNCYNVNVKLGTNYLIRASFLYGNYDGRSSIPEFDLHFGPNFWTTVTMEKEENIIHEEIIHITTSDHVQVCLINIGNGIPFVSALEFRPLAISSYNTVSGSLANIVRLDTGSQNTFIRYPDDVYDRVWSSPVPILGWAQMNTSSPVYNQDDKGYIAPSVVLKTCATVMNGSAPLMFSWDDPKLSNQYYMYLYFAELQILKPSQSRIFKIYLNDQIWYHDDFSPRYLKENIIITTKPLTVNATYEFKLIMSEGSTLPPILNALEVFKVINFTQPTTEQDDDDAIVSIKKIYGVSKNWEGDPCLPKAFAWQGLNCSYDSSNPSRITSLNLSSSGLNGEITANIRNLTRLEVLDLSNNSLNGSVPDFLAAMPLLRVLNLSRNNLSGQIPIALTDKRNKGSLSLSLEGNQNLYVETPSEEKKKNVVIPVIAAVAGGVVVIIVILVSIYFIRRKQSAKGSMALELHSRENSPIGSHPIASLESPSRQYSYSDILRITNNFGRLLGEGGFGKVYYGRMGNTEVAVKMLTPKSAQGYREFQAEVDLLIRVHHRNLTSLVGYCNEGERKMGLVYEYMCRGDLGSLLLGGKEEKLRWEDRIQIALDSAQGLEYLHSGCRPPIIHRDIKSSNILLNEYLQAKLADFGLSRAFPTDGGATHVTTKVVGTLGYLDPEYHESFRLTEKSDIYSFGIVLLELITGRPVLVKTSERSHIVQWVDLNINQGYIYAVVDSKIKESCNLNSVWKAVDIAMSCTAYNSSKRPTMSEVVNELKECLDLELNQREGHQVNSAISISSTFNSELGPMAR